MDPWPEEMEWSLVYFSGGGTFRPKPSLYTYFYFCNTIFKGGLVSFFGNKLRKYQTDQITKTSTYMRIAIFSNDLYGAFHIILNRIFSNIYYGFFFNKNVK